MKGHKFYYHGKTYLMDAPLSHIDNAVQKISAFKSFEDMLFSIDNHGYKPSIHPTGDKEDNVYLMRIIIALEVMSKPYFAPYINEIFKAKPMYENNWTEVYRNQALREAQVIASDDDHYMIEYEMPSGVTFRNVIKQGSFQPWSRIVYDNTMYILDSPHCEYSTRIPKKFQTEKAY